ncbi:ATP-binding cassette sub-family B member 10, mitochondrial [Prorops nasuta]|uniref:ATP-binding cassette sub-family B member 10, mitochondrial n=1 Tax=Prorops nasuta TaxID=863751 RepID=UPI0034CDD1FA
MILVSNFYMSRIAFWQLRRSNVKFLCKQKFHTLLVYPVKSTGRSCTLNFLRHQNTKILATKSAGSILKKGIKLNKSSELKQLFVLAKPEKWRLAAAIIFLFISSTVTMAVPFSLGRVIDVIYTKDKEKMRDNLNKICFILFGVFVIGALSNFVRVYFMSTAGHNITQRLRKQAYSSILKQETALFDQQSTGELVGRLSGDAQLVSSSVTQNLSDGLRSAIMTTAGISMMFYMSSELAAVSLITVPAIAGVAVVYGRFLKQISRDVQNSLAVLNTTAEEKISNIRTVKAFGQELNEIKKYSLKLQDLLRLCYKESLYRGIFFGFTGFSGNVIIFSVLYYGGLMISSSSITVGNLSAFLIYAAYVGISINGLTSFYTELHKALGANTRLFELINRNPLIPIQGGKILEEGLSGNIEFRNVAFAYPSRKNSLILDNFDLTIEKYTSAAIVGSSGSGKTTIGSLLLRLYDPNKGMILLDNYSIKDLDPMWVKSQIGVVPQEPILFSGTIKENIIYGKEEATDDEIIKAARQANVLEFVENMPNRLDTIIGERGITLSGGQRQRVAIARALIKDPKILILDEATSALDAESENCLQKTLETAKEGRTMLTIAHRLSTIKNADKIIVLNQGRVVELGTYNELINIPNGFFKKLVKHQTFT